ncbi:hypothetical protein D3C77_468840 [compost metagenome]
MSWKSSSFIVIFTSITLSFGNTTSSSHVKAAEVVLLEILLKDEPDAGAAAPSNIAHAESPTDIAMKHMVRRAANRRVLIMFTSFDLRYIIPVIADQYRISNPVKLGNPVYKHTFAIAETDLQCHLDIARRYSLLLHVISFDKPIHGTMNSLLALISTAIDHK